MALVDLGDDVRAPEDEPRGVVGREVERVFDPVDDAAVVRVRDGVPDVLQLGSQERHVLLEDLRGDL